MRELDRELNQRRGHSDVEWIASVASEGWPSVEENRIVDSWERRVIPHILTGVNSIGVTGEAAQRIVALCAEWRADLTELSEQMLFLDNEYIHDPYEVGRATYVDLSYFVRWLLYRDLWKGIEGELGPEKSKLLRAWGNEIQPNASP